MTDAAAAIVVASPSFDKLSVAACANLTATRATERPAATEAECGDAFPRPAATADAAACAADCAIAAGPAICNLC